MTTLKHGASPTLPTRSPLAVWLSRLAGPARDKVLVLAVSMILAQLAFRAWAVYGGWFQVDDFNFISRMGHEGLDPITASRSYFGHVMPAAMYLSWANHVVAPWNWAVPATELLLLHAVADLGMLRLLVSFFGRRMGILPPLALFLFSAISIEGGIWYAAAINLLPLEIALFFGLTAHVAYLRTGGLRHAVGANAIVVAGLLFNEKSALVYLAIALVTLCYFATGHGWSRVRSALAGRSAALVIYVSTGLVHLAVYLAVGRDFNPGTIVSYPTYRVAANVILHGFVPGLLGGPFRWRGAFADPGSLVAPGDGAILVTTVLLGLIANEIVRHRRRAARAFILPAAFLVIDTVLVLVTRASAAGPLISLDYRYQGEMAALTALGLALATMPLLGATEASERRSPSELLDHPRRVLPLVVAVSVLGLYSSALYVSHWHDSRESRIWVERVTATLDRAEADVPLVDAPVPSTVTNGYRYPENLQSRVLARQRHAGWTTVATDELNMIDDSGRVVAAGITSTRTGLPGSQPGCGYFITGKGATIDLDGPVAFGGWWVRIGYLASGDSPVRVTTGGRSVATTVRSGVHALYFLGGEEFDSVKITGLSADVQLCTDDVTVGHPEPLEASPS